ncbi:MAG TPA: SPASM domain-containing protein, partial [bacterium]|nr:SPASM domain-containing protein [bacterium]
INAIDLLIQSGLKVIIKTPVMRSNSEEMVSLKKFSNQVGADFISNPMIVPRTNGSKDNLDLRLTAQQLYRYYKEINPRWSFFKPEAEQPLCSAGRGTMAITPFGDVYPCVQIQIKAGNITDQPLEKIWLKSHQMNKVRQLTLAQFSKCAACPDIEFCSPCPGLALAEEGNLTAPSAEACRQTRVRKTVFKKPTTEVLSTPATSPINNDCFL